MIRILLKIVLKGTIDNKPALVYGRQTIIWTNADTIHWSIYAALGEDKLNVGLADLYWLERSADDRRYRPSD